jgi:rhomboid protease GluP
VRHRLVPRAIASRLRPRLIVVLGLNALFSLLPLFSSSMPRIDLLAHAGGGVVGFLLIGLGLLTRGLTLPGRPDPTPLRIAALVMVGLLAGSLVVALIRGQPWQQLGAI